jgi:alkylated DNA repair protein alkB family protein 6
VLVNEYVAPAGISPHNDGDVYAPHVAIVTLGGAALMDFWPNDGSVTADDDRRERDEREPTPIAQVLLRPRSLLLYSGDAYGLRHGIRHRDVDFVTDRCVNAKAAGVEVGDEVERGRVRYSVVFVRKGGRG